MKTPPEQYPDDVCRNKTEEYIKKYGGKMAAAAATPAVAKNGNGVHANGNGTNGAKKPATKVAAAKKK
jgi:hypothetical protein